MGDHTIQELCHHDLHLHNGKARRDLRLAEWAEKKFGLTAMVDDGFEERDTSSFSPCSIRFQDVDPSQRNEDVQNLMHFCQVHECSGFCLRARNKNW